MLRRSASLRHVAALIAAAIFASGAAAAAPARSPKIDPGVMRVLQTGVLGPWQRSAPMPGSAPVVIELGAPATPATLADLRLAGAELSIVDGEIIAYDRFVPARVDAAALAAIAARPEVTRISLRAGRGPLPLDHSAELMRLEDARGARPAMDLLTGQGVVVGDVDSAIDIYHPTFFRGDGGYFDWIDVDKDGVFTPGVDAVDLDHDGKVSAGETGQVVRAETFVDYLGGAVKARNPDFDPAIDWVYLDTNGNGKRDYGKAGGFDDTAPAFGEPIFVPDDVNRNGKLDAGERLVRLGSSKFRKVYIDLNYPPLKLSKKHTYQRGKDLSTLPTDFSGGTLYGFPDALHATGVLGIVAGDLPLVGRRWVGIAPDAELLLGFEVDQNESLPATAAAWALKEKPNVMLYELAPWNGVALDGSDPLSAMIDTSNQSDGVVHTCPTGDQGSAHKHAHADIAAGMSASLALDVPAQPKAGVGPLGYVEISLHVQGGTPSAITVTGPGGDVIDAIATANGQGTITSTGAAWFTVSQTTARGVYFADVILYAADKTTPIPTGNWTVSVTAPASAAVKLDGFVADDKSSWGLGAGWDKAIATDVSTVGVPSTADHCIAVGAHPCHVNDASAPWFEMYYGAYDVPSNWVEAQGQVRAYSPRGPRIDGVQKPDLLAPDNPWTSQETGTDASGPPYGSFQVFGGTSGASPHVTGAAALLAQAGMKGDAVRDALRMGAVADATTGTVPNGDYGYGRLDVAAALGVKTKGARPTITLTATPAKPTTKDTVTLTPAATSGDSSSGLEIKWDDDYDGTWDSAYAPVAARQIKSDTPVTRPFKARVRNAAGHIAEAVVWVTFTAPSTTPPMTDAGGCGCRTAPATPAIPALAAGLAVAALAVRRRRSRR
jgi:MYXO-CTERM domain-containing protein